ncbi:hypothetical protein [Bacillus pumilus]|uniref:hypothetical protein n=1 Tax=Bacillus pumilus TaxID=1408 RepID=UPI00119D9D40|nr:hypothetical protein [Bacillus pumilus]
MKEYKEDLWPYSINEAMKTILNVRENVLVVGQTGSGKAVTEKLFEIKSRAAKEGQGRLSCDMHQLKDLNGQ